MTTIITEVTPEVIAWARSLVAQVDGPPPLAVGERVIYSPGYSHRPQPAVVRSLYYDGRVQIRTMLAGQRAGETVSDWYCRTVRADQLTRPGAV
jgi:hypothetical protein